MPNVPTDLVLSTESDCTVSGRPFDPAAAGLVRPTRTPAPDSARAALRRELETIAWALVARLAEEHAADQDPTPEIPLDRDEGSR